MDSYPSRSSPRGAWARAPSTGQWTPDGNDQHSRGAFPGSAVRAAGRARGSRPAGSARRTVGGVWMTWRQAMQAALYGPGGFYARGESPARHFRTSVHVSPGYAAAVLELLREVDASLGRPERIDLVDVGAGRAELLEQVLAVASAEPEPARRRLAGRELAGPGPAGPELAGPEPA